VTLLDLCFLLSVNDFSSIFWHRILYHWLPIDISSAEFKEVDAEKILDLQQQQQQQQQHPLSPFPAVLCRWGLTFFPNIVSTLTNIYKLLSSGGRTAAAVWSEPAKVPKLYTAIDIVTQKLDFFSYCICSIS
jgi:hypothetical protein